MIIRQENISDYAEIYNVIKLAFLIAEHRDGNEQDLVNKLRNSSNFIPDLSLVAIEDKQIVGHILFTEATIGTKTVLALAPLSVLPQYQKKGIGTALITEGHKIAKEKGYLFSVVLGSEKYYSRMGYIPACNYGILPPFDVPCENFMACNLTGKKFDLHGILQYANEFFEE